MSEEVLGVFGDSLTTSPSYASPLAQRLNVNGFRELATGGWSSTQLLAAIEGSSIPAEVTTSVICVGVNDVLASVSASTIQANLAAIEALVPDAHFVTIPPCGNYTSWTSGKESVRQAVNTWMLANLANVTNIETVIGDSDPSQPVLLAQYDQGDGLHWNEAGDRRVAEELALRGYA